MLLRFLLLATLAGLCPAAQPAVTLLPEMALPADNAATPGEGPLRHSLAPYVKRWHEQRSTWAGEVAQNQGAVAFFGDSITQGWGPDFQGHFPGMKLVNRGLAGDTSRGLLIRIGDVLALQPAAIVMLFGTNDVADAIDPGAIGRNLRRMLAATRARYPEVPVVLCRIMPSSTEKKRPAARIREINTLFDAIARSDPRITVLDTWTLFADPATGDADPKWFRDMIHLNPAGYARWAEALRPLFTKLGLPGSDAGFPTPAPAK